MVDCTWFTYLNTVEEQVDIIVARPGSWPIAAAVVQLSLFNLSVPNRTTWNELFFKRKKSGEHTIFFVSGVEWLSNNI